MDPLARVRTLCNLACDPTVPIEDAGGAVAMASQVAMDAGDVNGARFDAMLNELLAAYMIVLDRRGDSPGVRSLRWRIALRAAPFLAEHAAREGF